MPQPWRGVLSLGNLTNDRTIIALGQSRHLGAGLLVPYDVPEEEFIYLQQAYKERKNDQ
jgi:CRISPR-associated protein